MGHVFFCQGLALPWFGSPLADFLQVLAFSGSWFFAPRTKKERNKEQQKDINKERNKDRTKEGNEGKKERKKERKTERKKDQNKENLA